MPSAHLRLSDEVTEALREDVGVVALESTIIAHGLPFPANLEIAQALEATVRERGAIPATIAIVDGVPTVGLAAGQLERLASEGTLVAKTSAVDMACYLAAGRSAATTVSATTALARRAGIRVFATGGIGGVHRGDTGDISHDLFSLSSHAIAVVSAGAKAILDLGRTLEMLETLGVLVLGYRTDEFPAFYTRETGLPLEHRYDDPAAIARVLAVRFDQLGQRRGVLIANPIPAADAMVADDIERAIAEALARAQERGIAGKALTPFLLAALADVTDGASIAANRALALSNAALAAEIAVAYAASTAASNNARGESV